MAILLLALDIPDAKGDESADIVASEIAEIINEERVRNGGPQRPEERVAVHLWPTPQFVTGAQIKWLMDTIRKCIVPDEEGAPDEAR